MKLQEFMDFRVDWIMMGTMHDLSNMNWETTRHGRPTVETLAMMPAREVIPPIPHPAPFINWADFKQKAREFFMTMETRDEVI